MLQEAIHDRHDLDILAQPLDPRLQTADAADVEPNFDARATRFVQRVDHFGVDQGVDLGDDLRVLPFAPALGFGFDQPQ